MHAAEIIDQITSAGGRIWLDEDKVKARLPESLRPLAGLIHSQKPELMAELVQRPNMPPGVRLIRWEPKAAPVQLSPYLTVINVDKFISRTLKQLEYRLQGKEWLACWTLSVLIDRLTACGCRVALDDPTKALQ